MYLLDANVFIQAKNFHYGFAFCPAFWDWLDDAFARNVVFSVEKVYAELNGRSDELTTWVSTRANMFLKPDTKVTPSLQKLSVWANSGFYKPAAVSEFLQAADYFLIAHAEAYQYIVVTHEQPSLSSKKIKIPDACDAMSVKWTSPFEMLEAEQALFVLKT